MARIAQLDRCKVALRAEAKLYRKGPGTLLAVKIRRPVPSISVRGRFVRAIPRLKLFIDAHHILFSR